MWPLLRAHPKCFVVCRAWTFPRQREISYIYIYIYIYIYRERERDYIDVHICPCVCNIYIYIYIYVCICPRASRPGILKCVRPDISGFAAAGGRGVGRGGHAVA